MATISAKLIRKPRRYRDCEGLLHRGNTLIEENAVRLYGYACEGDPPYVMWICRECAEASTDEKIRKAVA